LELTSRRKSSKKRSLTEPDGDTEITETIGSARAWAAQELKSAGVESATITAELLIGHVLRSNRIQIITRPEAPLSSDAMAELRMLVRRRLQGEPLQYLTGVQEFYGLEFRVTPDVLVPRPETELMVEQAIGLAADIPAGPVRFADVGTGSGCIAVSFARMVPASLGVAVDISLPALKIARENASRHGVAERIGFICGDLLGGLSSLPHFDLILSNPPYVADSEYSTLPVTVRDYEPHKALFAGDSALAMYDKLLPQASERLRHHAYLLLEVGIGQAEEVSGMMARHEFSVRQVLRDLQGIPRCIVACRK
jgi:release factor glutamine methyltransferase